MIDRAGLGTTVMTLAVAAAGGIALGLLGVPAGWLTGAMVAAAIVALAGVPVEYPAALRNVVFVMLGSSLGTGVSPELVAHLNDWPISLAILFASVALVQIACQLFLSRVCGWDRQTAFFAAIPGMANYVIAMALPTGANTMRIALSQSLRVFLLVGLMPSALTAVGGVATTTTSIGSPTDLLLTAAVGTVGGILLSFSGLPAGSMIGAMAASALLYGSGVASGSFPMPLQIALFIAMGAFAGSRFAGTTLAMIRQAMVGSVGSFVIAVAVSALAAWLAATVTGQSFSQLAFAFAPGGMDVMATMAFALNLDTAFVAAHQLARFFVIAIYAPAIARRDARVQGTQPSTKRKRPPS